MLIPHYCLTLPNALRRNQMLHINILNTPLILDTVLQQNFVMIVKKGSFGSKFVRGIILRRNATLGLTIESRQPGLPYPYAISHRHYSVKPDPNSNSKYGSNSNHYTRSYVILLTALAAMFSGSASYYWGCHNQKTMISESKSSIDHSYLNKDCNPSYGGKDAFHKALTELEQVVTKSRVTTDPDVLHAHGYSDWSTYNVDTNPIAVIYPETTEEVSAIARICYHHKLPMIGFSGGSSLEGNFCAPYGGICIDFAHMNKIIKVRPDDMDITLQPAIGWMDLNRYLEEENYGMFLAVDPGPTAQIGGMIATSCSGTNCVRYGPMRDHIINLTVVLADGSIIKTRQRPRKSSAGYNLNHLFCGSEGTLGLITEATLKLQPIPAQTNVAVCSFPTVRDATAASTDIIRAGIPVQAIELLDDKQMWAINQAGYTSRKWLEQPTLFIKFSGTKSSIEEQIDRAKRLSNPHNGSQFIFAKNEEEGHQLWAARKEALWSNLAVGPKDGKVFSTDVAVPISKLADLVLTAQRKLSEIKSDKVFATTLGHVGDGNFHCSIIYTDEDKAEVSELARAIVEEGLALEGTCTGEHGVGAGKIEYLVDELGTEPVALMRTIKLALDPYELLNPGKIFTAESLRRNSKE